MKKNVPKTKGKVAKFPINEVTMLYIVAKQNDLNLRIQRQSDIAYGYFKNAILYN